MGICLHVNRCGLLNAAASLNYDGSSMFLQVFLSAWDYRYVFVSYSYIPSVKLIFRLHFPNLSIRFLYSTSCLYLYYNNVICMDIVSPLTFRKGVLPVEAVGPFVSKGSCPSETERNICVGRSNMAFVTWRKQPISYRIFKMSHGS